MKQNHDQIDQQANAFVAALRSQRHAHMPVMRFHQWPHFISTVRTLLANNN
ncbi:MULTISPECIES: hypothetical protein [Erwiniaceae]|uniref:hypothetical protein n=1 Tax=Erwiniaceae TaxID=1903409 RepID=UPI000A5E425F|nr:MULTISPECIES: hypothetical protein [Erwiniaceae]MBK0092512.1 hypothetical protein [Erwinia sp. S59]MBK0122137.1 hypothetical protein [Pantoea sp. S61]MBK0123154.1 hypothetical protein [Pantoea sp. S61]